MTDSVESAKTSAKVEDKSVEAAKASPADLLKKAVSGKPETKTEAGATPPASPAAVKTSVASRFAIDGRTAIAAGVALVIGMSFGMMTAPRERSGDALTRIEAALDASRTESAHLHAQVERLSTALGSLRDTTTAARTDMRTIAPSLGERVAKLEQGLDKKFAALTERVARSEHEQAAPAVAPAPEKRAAAPTNTAPSSAPKAEPAQTGSINEAKQKPETVESWALREVYDGVAMLEDRKRRLLEVAPGDSVPGVGRVEAIERRGRNWIVVTKQGVITTQTW